VNNGPTVDFADALEWLARRDRGTATLVVYDPPYAVGTPVRGREDGAAGSVFGPFGFLSRSLALCARCLRPGGIVMVFADWRRMPDLAYIATTRGLRASTCIAWIRNRPGTGGLFRSAWDPILIASRGVPDAVDRAAVPNVIVADYPTRRRHPYQKPRGIFDAVFPRVCRPGELVLDPFAGSGVTREAAESLGLRWAGCDIDPAFAHAATDDDPDA
jgi:site-specific DNA-methyltransferase (adenine-specific)